MSIPLTPLTLSRNDKRRISQWVRARMENEDARLKQGRAVRVGEITLPHPEVGHIPFGRTYGRNGLPPTPQQLTALYDELMVEGASWLAAGKPLFPPPCLEESFLNAEGWVQSAKMENGWSLTMQDQLWILQFNRDGSGQIHRMKERRVVQSIPIQSTADYEQFKLTINSQKLCFSNRSTS